MRAEGALKIAAFGTVCAPTPAQLGVLIEADDTRLTLRTHDWESAVNTRHRETASRPEVRASPSHVLPRTCRELAEETGFSLGMISYLGRRHDLPGPGRKG
ncbi:NUDIX hydrolase [Streptomyces parvus]|uniref:Uncharacterized protein n=1 Tax=Streptomyces parvus TaxID=66428 RepID=A0A5D4JIS4_9ACTN|nr:hypothetical protein [Streptomyces parvus]TYR64110.1 hypothetical protein FY004_13380 [Streptomyces parvus]